MNPTMKTVRRIYLDVCCLNRPFDDQKQHRVHMESEAVLTILAEIQRNEHLLIASEALQDEVAENPDGERRHKVRDALRLATYDIKVESAVMARAEELGKLGLGAYDTLHIACAEAANADVLLTTDDDFIRKVRRTKATRVKVCNPLGWIAARSV